MILLLTGLEIDCSFEVGVIDPSEVVVNLFMIVLVEPVVIDLTCRETTHWTVTILAKFSYINRFGGMKAEIKTAFLSPVLYSSLLGFLKSYN